MSILTHLELIGHHPTEIELTISTPARMRKTDNPFPNAIKVQTLRCKVNFDYEEEMTKLEGGWVSEDRKWGKHIPGTCLIGHKAEKYVQVLVLEASDPIYADGADRIPTEILRPFLQPSNPSKIRDVKVSNIVTLGLGDRGVVKVDKAAAIPA